MELDANSWYVRYFYWSDGVWTRFKDGYTSVSRDKRTNLCYFIRVMTIYAPLVLLLHAIVYGLCVAAIAAVPIFFFGVKGYSAVVGAIIVVVGIIALVAWLVKRAKRRRRLDWYQQAVAEKDKEIEKAASPPFYAVVVAWLKAHKQKICPQITIR